MNPRLFLLALLVVVGCAHCPLASSPSKNKTWARREPRLWQGLTNQLNQSSELVAVVKQIDAAWALTRLNIANAQTVAYKKVVPVFENNAQLFTRRSFAHGDLNRTDRNLDVAIEGVGFFEVQMPDGTRSYTRDGAFRVGADGRITTNHGYPVSTWPVMNGDTKTINISPEGLVTCAGSGGAVSFSMQLVRFAAPEQLSLNSAGLFVETAASGSSVSGNPGQEGMGQVMQGFLEQSNVHLVEENVRLATLESWKRDILKALEL